MIKLASQNVLRKMSIKNGSKTTVILLVDLLDNLYDPYNLNQTLIWRVTTLNAPDRDQLIILAGKERKKETHRARTSDHII